MTRSFLVLLIGFALPWAAARVHADTLILASGTRIAGTVVSVSQGAVTFKDSVGVTRRYRSSDIVAIEFTPTARKAAASVLTLRDGTELTVRLLEVLDSSVAAAGQTYVATLEQDLVESGTVVLPKGSSAQIGIREAAARAGSRAIRLEIRSLTVGGRQFRLSAPESAGSSEEGEPVKPRVFSSRFSSRPSSPAAPAIRLVVKPSALLSASLPGDGSVAGIELLPDGQIRVQAGARFTFTAAGLVALQAPR